MAYSTPDGLGSIHTLWYQRCSYPLQIYTIGLNTINSGIYTMTKKRKQGEKYPPGYIKNQILLKLCQEEEMETSEIMDFLKECFNTREIKGIRAHLKELESKKLIKRESAGKGHPDHWRMNTDPGVFKKLLGSFAETGFEAEFMETEYCLGRILFDGECFEAFEEWYVSRRDALIEKIRNLTRKNMEFQAQIIGGVQKDLELDNFRDIIASICPSCIDPEKLDAAVNDLCQSTNQIPAHSVDTLFSHRQTIESPACKS